ncbi:eukaryotic translation initiation factor 2A [Planococcus citri]|uniref:eukaryotic translation initiation factor 2A n=1 Tax=Planococcus citri TaxID=170843 RepID=UPI0031F9F9E4
MSTEVPVLAVRGSTGVILSRGPPSYDPVTAFPTVTSKNCKVMLFSPNGQYFAWFDGSKIVVTLVSSWKVVQEIEKPKTMCLLFSPKGTYLCSWETFYVNQENPKGGPNLFIWKTETGELVHSYIHKKQINWQLQFSKDEKICARCLDGQVLIYEKANFETPTYKIQSPKVADFSLSPGSIYHVLCYMPGSSGPSFGKLFKYPKFEHENCVANKTFFKADRVDMYWNNKGTNVLLLTSTDVDKTNASYYGKQSLHFLSTKGDTAIVLLNKEGSIHSISWNPSGEEFCVIYGFMPAKAALFNTKCEVIFDFGSGPRNSIYYNPHGNIVLLGGFGNISGYVEIWDTVSRRRITKMECSNTTLLQWSPDGTHFVTATTAPRLRVDNGFKIWHYSGALLYERPWNKQEELWEVTWQTYADSRFKKPTISFKHVEGIQSSEPTASKEVYRPPAARNLANPVKFNLHDNTDTAETRTLSKAALKMKKKRDAKRQAKLQQQQNQEENTTAVVNNGHSNSDNGAELRNANAGDKTNNRNVDKDKIKKIKTNLKSIEKLKQLQASGKELDKNQLEKLNKEAELQEELKNLTL